MDLFTIDRNYDKVDQIDTFNSAIWTERYYGDGDVTLVVPETDENKSRFATDALLGCEDSEEVMIIENQNVENGSITATGITVLEWMNNRFIRTSADHATQTWVTATLFPGEAMKTILDLFCLEGPFLDGTNPIGIPVSVLNNFKIPRMSIIGYDTSGVAVEFSIPFGPVYDAMKNIGTTYQLGMKIVRHTDVDGHFLGFIGYKGDDRTSDQSVLPAVQFSPEMETLTGIKEVRSSENYKNLVYMFASDDVGGLTTDPGRAGDITKSGFDLRAAQLWADSVTSADVGGSSATLLNVLNSQAAKSLDANKYVTLIDGQIVPNDLIQYGVHYNLGDIVELKGNSGAVSHARITEYIRSKDNTGEKAYPTVEVIG